MAWALRCRHRRPARDGEGGGYGRAPPPSVGDHRSRPARREAYADDLGDPRALAAVTARSNRQKADQDPATWIPPHAPALCRYVTEWTAVKLRWGLAADAEEQAALSRVAEGCPNATIEVTPAP
ncbi:hypothetical protein [Spongiactinospora sp. 9N601]|uniref:hypothetical protein n=1 Tax=Spongiactinospora sp. 9N601 TaxID=3375149 RepID=UPI0037899919